VCVLGGLRRSNVPCIAVEKRHPHLQTPGGRSPGLFSVGYYEGVGVMLPGLLVKLDPVGLF
jgi:hypothetical protein